AIVRIVKLMLNLALCLLMSPVFAQNCERVIRQFHPEGPAKLLTKQEAVMLALRNNPQIQAAKLQRVLDKFALEVARNEFEPHYKLGATGFYTADRTLEFRGGPGVSLRLPSGTDLSIDTDPVIYGEQTGKLTMTIRQPLLRGFDVNVNMAKLRNAEDNECMQRLAFKDQFQTTITQVVTAYHQLVQDYNTLEVDRASLKDSNESLRGARLQIKAGNRAETSITQTAAQVARQRFSIMRNENTIKQNTQKLLLLLGLNPHAKITVVHTIDIANVKVPSEQESIRLALRNNVGYQTSLINARTLNRSLLVARDEQRWALGLVVSNTQNFVIPGDEPFNDRRVALDLSIPIDDKVRQQSLLSAKIAVDKFKIKFENDEKQLISDVITGLRDIRAQQQQIQLAEQAVKYSWQSFHIAQKKLQHGRTTEFEVTTLLTQLTSEQQALINQKIAFLNTVAQFEQLLGVSLDRWQLKLCY
ncbi:MAG: TolC family protein, partial [Pseudomonadota bacterium]|nr:TolC family protein [Pseudomonadota bacterium]